MNRTLTLLTARSRFAVLAFVAVLAQLAAPSAFGATMTWIGGYTGSNKSTWANAGNWVEGSYANNRDIIFNADNINGTPGTYLANGRQVKSITFNGGSPSPAFNIRCSTTFGGGTAADLTFILNNTGITVASTDTANHDIGQSDGNIVLQDKLLVTHNGSGTLTLSRPITGAFAVTKAGTGTLVLSATNAYTGGTTINGGTLALGANSTLGTNNNVSLAGGTLDMGGYTNAPGTLAVTSDSALTLGAGSVSFADSSAVTWTGNLTLTGALGATTLRFGTNANGLTSAQLARINCNGANVILNTNGYLALAPTIRVETAADGSGTVVPAQTLQAGQSIAMYAISRDANGVFLANVPASWSLSNVTGFVTSGDLAVAADSKSAVFTAGSFGTAVIQASGAANSLVSSGTITVGSTPIFGATRPFIWATAAERQGILDKIATHSWATSMANSLISRVAADLAAYEANRDGYLRGLPVDWTLSPPLFRTFGVGSMQGMLGTAQDCAVIYYLTGNPRYARLAADVLQNVTATLYNMQGLAGNSGYAYARSTNDGDLFLDAREVAYQMPIVYDFLQGYLQSNQVWNVSSGSLIAFPFTNAQTVFTTYWTIIGNYNSGTDNWSAFMRNSFLHNGLALDSAQARSNALDRVVDTRNGGGSKYEPPLSDNAADFDQAAPFAVWPESTQYASVVQNRDIYQMSVIEHCDPSRAVYSRFSLIPESVQRLSQISYPSGNQRICYGDGYHDIGINYGMNFQHAEIVYHTAKQLGRTDLLASQGSVLAQGLAVHDYSRSSLPSDQDGLIKLLWSEPIITEAPVDYTPVYRTDTLPFAGIALQRNLSPSGDGTYGLMTFVGGASYVHSHATGMFMELYGMGQALGVMATGKDNYVRTYAAHNTVVVNGYSQGNGGWGDNGMNTVQVVAMEPAARQSAVSPNISFTCSSFVDDVGTGAEATEQRTMAIIRTSPTTGYYVDIFRSDSSLPNQYHDYIYHNIGGTPTVTDTNGTPLTLTTQTNRFTDYTYTTTAHGTYSAPGWGSWTSVKASSTFTNDVLARFTAQPTGTPAPIYMDLRIPGDTNREYATAKAPNGDGDLPAPYDGTTLVPTLDIRKYGSAWNNPFVVVYEPHGGTATSGSVTNVTTLTQNGVVIGLKVQSVVNGTNVTQYVLSHPNANDSYSDAVAGLYFKGRFAVATLRGDGTGELYLGSGSSLGYNGWLVTSASGTNTQASVLLNASGPTSVTANTPVNVSASVVVPNVVGLDPATAITNLTAAGLTVGTLTSQYSETVPQGKVSQQDPVSGIQAVRNSVVNIGISAGPSPMQVVNAASVVVVDTGGSTSLETTPYVVSFNAGTNADKLVVVVSGEGLPSTFGITYRGAALTKITGSGTGRLQGIFYLDQPYTGGAANLVFDCRRSDAAVNGLGAGIVSFTGANPGGPGAVAVAADKSVNITTTRGGSWVVAGFGGNNVNSVTVALPLSSLYSASDIGSACGAAGYEAKVASGDHTYSFTTAATDSVGTCAVEILSRASTNNVPVFVSDVGDQSTPLNISTPAIPFSVYGGSGATLTVTATSSNTAVLPSGGITLVGSGTSRTITLTPAANQAGTSTVTLNVTDGITTATDTFVLTVTTTLADDWRKAQFGTYANTGNSADAADPDGDGLTNAQEYILGTNPMASDGSSPMTIAVTGGNLTLTFLARQIAGTGYNGLTRYYTVESSNDLTNSAAWTPLAGYTDIPATGQMIQVVVPIATAPRFYHLKVRLQ